MKVTYLVGNGLDIHIGLKTRYSDFYDYLENSNDINLNNKVFKSIIEERFETQENNVAKIDWSDFEIAIGKYVDRISNKDDLNSFIEDFEEFVDEFTNFIDDQLISLNLDKFTFKSNEIFHESILRPIKLDERDQIHLNEIYKKTDNQNQERNFIVFNYTKIFEDIVVNWIRKNPNSSIKINNPIHIHGYSQMQTLMGVNDESQLCGVYSTDEDLQMMLIKTKSNEKASTLRFEKATKLLKESNLIIVFGMSLGESDKYWWQKIIENLENDSSSNVIIYAYEHDKKALNKFIRKMFNKQNQWKNKLLIQSENEINQELKSRIFIQFDTQKIFNFENLVENDYAVTSNNKMLQK
ncbi:AbiH family protein [Exiguobacterium aurantiacum]|uniref:AbiH family protein n=1 Tax=Exiguobacterium aurantiacum TaxID=33987 RepID=UPI001E307FCB|nr:AbiH family protein [Exiguobacterium aurantiacum]